MADIDLFGLVTEVVVEYVLWAIPFFVGIAALRVLLLPKLRGAQGEAKVGRLLGKLFGDVLHDIIIPDGRGGLTQIDHVALTAKGFLVIETKNYSGAIFGQERDAQWTQRLGGRSYQFENPLRQNYLHLSALKALQLGVPVHGCVVFTDDATFPNGVPEGVSQLRTLRREQDGLGARTDTPATYATAWESLKQIARTDKLARKEHLAVVREKKGGDLRPRVASILLALSVAWLVILWTRSDPPISRLEPTTKRGTPAPATARSIAKPDVKRYTGVPTDRNQRNASGPVSEIAWSSQESSKSDECNLALAAVLIDNSVDNEGRRDRACAGDRPAWFRASD